jgi:hypothetical protein
MEKLFLIKDPEILAEFNLLGHATEMFRVIDSEQRRVSLKGIKLTVTAYCEPNIQADSGHLWKTVRFAVRLLKAHRSKIHLDISLTVDQDIHVTTCTCDSGTNCISMFYNKQNECNDAFQKVAAHIVSRLQGNES